MNIDTNLRQAIHDLCFHEAGHLVALYHFGHEGHIRIKRETPDTITGYVSCKRSDLIDPWKRRVVGLAGRVANMIQWRNESAVEMDNPDDHHIDPREIAHDFMLSAGIGLIDLSESDAELAGNFEWQDVYATAVILKHKWDAVEFYALCEIRAGVLNEGGDHGE